VWVRAPIPTKPTPCVDLVERMILSTEGTTGGVIATCEVPSGSYLSFVTSDQDALQLASWEVPIVLIEPDTNPLGVLSCTRYLGNLVGSTAPQPDPVNARLCSMQRGQVSSPRRVWVLIREDLQPASVDPDTDCLSLLRYMGESGPATRVPVLCTWQ
jgi:hypothetical protein